MTAFEVANGEPNNGVLKRNRTTAFRADLWHGHLTSYANYKAGTTAKRSPSLACLIK